MKTTLAVLAAVLLLLTTPLLAAAYGGGRDNDRSQHNRGWVHERHEQRLAFREHRYAERRAYRAANRHGSDVNRHRTHSRSWPNSYRPLYAAAPTVVVAVPRIVFRIGW